MPFHRERPYVRGFHMYVRLANAWTDQGGTSHDAGETVEIDNLTLAELEAGGYVGTEEETTATTVRDPEHQGAGVATAGKNQDPNPDGGSAEPAEEGTGIKPHPDGWPGMG